MPPTEPQANTNAEKPTPLSTSLRSRGSKHLAAVDGLRAFAVLIVIAFHLRASSMPGGFTGVDVFFVISGYVVSLALLGHKTEGFLKFITSFYLRRTARIYPALIVVLIATIVLSCLFIPRVYLSGSNDATGALAFFGLSNWGLIHFNDGYFSPTTDFNPYTHTWSLAVEEQFYFVFSPLFYLYVKSLSNPKYGFARLIFPVLCALSFVYSAFVSLGQASAAYYFLPSRFWELGTGAILLQAHSKGSLLPQTLKAQRACTFLGLGLLVVSALFADSRFFPFPWALPAVVGTALFISAVAADTGEATLRPLELFKSRPVVFVGLLSYSLYLWHWPLMVLARWTVGLEGAVPILVTLAASLGLALLSYKVIETPFKKGIRKASRPGLLLAGSLVIILGSYRLYNKIANHQPSLALTRTSGPDWQVGSLEPREIEPAQGKKWSAHHLYVLGDSHSAAYANLYKKANQEFGPYVKLYFQPGCWIANLREPSGSNTPSCQDFEAKSLDEVTSRAKQGDIVFLPSLRVSRLGDQWKKFDAKQLEDTHNAEAVRLRTIALKEADQILTRLDKTGATIVMDAPPPVFPAPAFRCVDWFDKSNPICVDGLAVPRNLFLKWRQPAMDGLAKLKSDHPGLVVWDPFDPLCPSSICRAVEESGRPLFFDGDHLSAHGDEVVYPSFAKMLTAIWDSKPKRA